MHLWIDNTGLHGAGKCLFGEAKTAYDYKGFMQLATLLVFAEKIQLNKFEPSEIVGNSSDYRDELIRIGLDDEALIVRETSRSEYAAACDEAAEYAGEELVYQFQPDEQMLLGIPVANIPRGAQFRPKRTERLAAGTLGCHEMVELRKEALDQKASGATDFMLAGSAKLREAVSRLIGAYRDWTPQHTFQVESLLRAYLNERLARQIGATYAPAAHRADLIARQNDWILDRLSHELDPIVNELRPEPLGIPSVQEALIRKSNGDPRGLIGEALAMRDRAADLRTALRVFQQSEVADGPASRHSIKNEIKDLARGVRQDLGLDGGFWDAVKINPVTGMPGAMSPKAVLDWLRLRLAKSQRVVLTDIVLSAAYSGVSEAVYRKLLDRCFGGRSRIEEKGLPRLQ